MRNLAANNKGLRAIRKRTRDSVEREYSRYMADLFLRAGAWMRDEYREVKNPGKLRSIEALVCGELERLVEPQGGSCTLREDETGMHAQLCCTGRSLVLEKTAFENLIADASGLRIDAGDGHFCLRMTYDLFDRVPAADHSRQIAALKACMKAAGRPVTESRC